METEEKLIRQYEHVRQSGLTNMFNTTAVAYIAKQLEFAELEDCANSCEKYMALLKAYGKLMTKYGVKRNEDQLQYLENA